MTREIEQCERLDLLLTEMGPKDLVAGLQSICRAQEHAMEKKGWKEQAERWQRTADILYEVYGRIEKFPQRYFAIFGPHTGEVIGFCTQAGVRDAQIEDPGVVFHEITQKEFEERGE